MYARATGPRDQWCLPPSNTTPLAGSKESSPVKIDFQHWRTPPGVEGTCPPPSSRAIVRCCSPTATAPCRRGAALPASRRGRRPSSCRLDTPAATCTRLAEHSVRSDFRRLPLPKPRRAQTTRAVDTAIRNPEHAPAGKQDLSRIWFATPFSPLARRARGGRIPVAGMSRVTGPKDL